MERPVGEVAGCRVALITEYDGKGNERAPTLLKIIAHRNEGLSAREARLYAALLVAAAKEAERLDRSLERQRRRRGTT